MKNTKFLFSETDIDSLIGHLSDRGLNMIVPGFNNKKQENLFKKNYNPATLQLYLTRSAWIYGDFHFNETSVSNVLKYSLKPRVNFCSIEISAYRAHLIDKSRKFGHGEIYYYNSYLNTLNIQECKCDPSVLQEYKEIVKFIKFGSKLIQWKGRKHYVMKNLNESGMYLEIL